MGGTPCDGSDNATNPPQSPSEAPPSSSAWLEGFCVDQPLTSYSFDSETYAVCEELIDFCDDVSWEGVRVQCCATCSKWDAGSCELCTVCGPGFEQVKQCTPTEDRECVPCPPGTYKLFEGPTPCAKQHQCDADSTDIVVAGSATAITQCSCKEGYHTLRPQQSGPAGDPQVTWECSFGTCGNTDGANTAVVCGGGYTAHGSERSSEAWQVLECVDCADDGPDCCVPCPTGTFKAPQAPTHAPCADWMWCGAGTTQLNEPSALENRMCACVPGYGGFSYHQQAPVDSASGQWLRVPQTRARDALEQNASLTRLLIVASSPARVVGCVRH